MDLNFTKLITTVVIILFTAQVNAQSTPEDLSNLFFKTFEEKGSTDALDELYSTNTWINKAPDAVLNLKNQMEGLHEDYIGKYYGYEFITEKKISESFVLRSYLVKYDRQPLRFTFQFYKPNDIWKAYSFQYDGNLSSELEESANIIFITRGYDR